MRSSTACVDAVAFLCDRSQIISKSCRGRNCKPTLTVFDTRPSLQLAKLFPSSSKLLVGVLKPRRQHPICTTSPHAELTCRSIRQFSRIIQILLQVLHRSILPCLIPFHIFDQLFGRRNLLLGMFNLRLDRQQSRLLLLECALGLLDFRLMLLEIQIRFGLSLLRGVDFTLFRVL